MSESLIPAVVRSLQSGLRWLKDKAESINDPREVAITMTALVRAERNARGQLVQRLAASLLQRQSVNGSWSDELWDTTWSLNALLAAGYPHAHPAIENGLRFLLATEDPQRGAWYEEPFETMLVLALLADLAPDALRSSAGRALTWLFGLQSANGSIIGVRYTGMAISLIAALPSDLASQYAIVARRAVNWLREDLASREIWTSASWSNHYALNALLDAGVSRDDPCVEKAVRWFLGAQGIDGRWMQVSSIHDTATAIMVLCRLLSVPLVDVSPARTGVISAARENGTLRVSYQAPGGGAIMPTDRLKLSDEVRAELGRNQQQVLSLVGRLRSSLGTAVPSTPPADPAFLLEELVKVGRYAYGHLFPTRIQMLLASSTADHVRLDVDERLIDLPWELLHDGSDFLCVKYALGRRIVSDQAFQAAGHKGRPTGPTRVLIVANPTEDLPAAEAEGARVADLLSPLRAMSVTHHSGRSMRKKEFLLSLADFDVVHFAGHTSHDPDNPDESALLFSDGEVRAFEISRFLSRSPAVVFLNSCWSAEEIRDPDAFSTMTRGLGRTFLYAGVTAFLGYLVPIPDESASDLAVTFYRSLAQGQTIGESLRRARVEVMTSHGTGDFTWSSAVLYGDPSANVVPRGTANDSGLVTQLP